MAKLTKDTVDLYRLLIDSVQDYAIFTLDPTGRIMSWNPGAERFKGYTAAEAIGQHFSIFYPPDTKAAGLPEHELIVASSEGRVEDEGWRVRKDGTRFWANVVITALREGGELIGFAKVTRDLTQRVAAEAQARLDARRVAEAEAANRAKSEFLAAMSHELRTPLNAIGGYLDLLIMGIRGPLTPQQLEDLERIRQSQHLLLGIINDLLNYSRIEAGRISYDIRPIRLGDIVDLVLPIVMPLAARREIQLVDVTPNCDVTVLADATKLEQILLNLVTNAVKFSPEGAMVTVACSVSDDRARMTVSDSGPGIPEDRHESIFEPFVQIGRTLTSSHEGAGLGLAISRELARAMGGDITVSSEVGVGSEFVVWMPEVEKG